MIGPFRFQLMLNETLLAFVDYFKYLGGLFQKDGEFGHVAERVLDISSVACGQFSQKSCL